MADKPTTLPEWASDGTNNTEPTSTQKDTGWTPGQDGVSDYDNWYKELVYRWVQYLSDLVLDAPLTLEGASSNAVRLEIDGTDTLHLRNRDDTADAALTVGAFESTDNADISGTLIVGGASTLAAVSASGTLSAGAAIVQSGDITPSAFGAIVNDWNPTGLSGASVIFASASVGSIGLTGLQGGVAGRIITIINSGGNAFDLFDEDTNSTAANRFHLPSGLDVTIPVLGGAVTLRYRGSNSRWYLISKNF